MPSVSAWPGPAGPALAAGAVPGVVPSAVVDGAVVDDPVLVEAAEAGELAAPVPLPLPLPWLVQAAADSSAIRRARSAAGRLMRSPLVSGRGWSGRRTGRRPRWSRCAASFRPG